MSCVRSSKLLSLGNCRQAFLLPITNTAKLNCFVTRFYESVSSARRAPTTASIEDDFSILRKFVHPLFDLSHRNMNRAGNCAAFLDLRSFAHVDDDWLFLGFKFLSKFRNR